MAEVGVPVSQTVPDKHPSLAHVENSTYSDQTNYFEQDYQAVHPL